MSPTGTYLALFTGTLDSAAVREWMAQPDPAREAREKAGLVAWHDWMKRHEAHLVVSGGPVGKTLSVSLSGTAAISNGVSGYCVVRADSHDAAVRLFENHPHFTVFPGDAVQVMPILPVPSLG